MLKYYNIIVVMAINLGTNIYTAPKNIKRTFMSSKQTFYADELHEHATKVCRDEFGQDVINSAINNYKNGYVYTIGRDIIGFVIWKIITNKIDSPFYPNPVPSKHLKILLICATKTGTTLGYTMLNDVENYCYQNSIPCMELHAINIQLEEYYKKYGFFTTQKFPIIIMWKPTLRLLELKGPHKTRRNSRNNISAHDRKAIEFLRDNGHTLEEGLNYTLLDQ